MSVYRWPVRIIEDCERAIRNFLWTGDSSKRRTFVVAYDKICCPYAEGGLGLRKMVVVNKSLLMKLWWNILCSKKIWAKYMRAKFFKQDGTLIDYQHNSSILGGIRWINMHVIDNSGWMVGNGDNISIWWDNWLGMGSIADILGIPDSYRMNLNAKLSSYIVDNDWNFTDTMRDILDACGVDTHSMVRPSGGNDLRVWCPDKLGKFSVKSAVEIIRQRQVASFNGAGILWKNSIHPTMSALNWRLLHPQCCATQDREVNILKHEMASLCYLCKNAEESLQHILWDCPVAQQCWQWLAGVFHTRPVDDFKACYKAISGRSSMDKDLWLLAIMVAKAELWKARNAICFEGEKINFQNLKTKILLQTSGYSRRIKNFMYNDQDDLMLVRVFNVQHKKVRSRIPVACEWRPPDEDSIMLCCDGAAMRNPGPAGAGSVLRDYNNDCVGALAIGLGLATNYDPEIDAIIEGLDWAREWAVLCAVENIIVASDSKSAASAFISGKLPWRVLGRWIQLKTAYRRITFKHVYREINFSADTMSKHAATLDKGMIITFHGKPALLTTIESEGSSYYRFK